MGYSTSLYAVDIAELISAVGSGDSAFLSKLQAATNEGSDDDEVQPESDIALLNPDSILRIVHENIHLDDRPITVDEVPTALSGAGINILEIVVHIPSHTQEDVLQAIHEYFPNSGIEKILIRYEFDNPELAKYSSPGPFLFRPLPDEEEDDDEIAPVIASFNHVSHDAISDLVFGNLTCTDSTHGSALELLCHVLGNRLRDGGMIGDLSPLELSLPLEHVRPPIPILTHGDFPMISHLTAQETAQEAERLSANSMNFPDDPDIEEARLIIRTCLGNAAAQNRGIVSFYQ
ncbi:MAG: hypothetical protein QM501_03125 [Gimesia sp.]